MDCLITKLKGTVNDDTLMKLGEIRIRKTENPEWDKASQLIWVLFDKDASLNIIGDGYFTSDDGTENKGKTLNCRANIGVNVLVSNGNFEISVENKYALKIFELTSLSYTPEYKKSKSIEVSAFQYSKKLEVLSLRLELVSGDISALQNLTALTKIVMDNTQVSGDISALRNLTALTNIEMSETQVSGDISALQNLTALTKLTMINTQVSGDISALRNLTALTNIKMYGTQVSGDISALQNLPSNLVFDLGSNVLTGDYFKFIYEHDNSDILCSGNFTYTTRNWSGKSYRRVGGDNFVCSDIDTFLNDFKVVSLSSIDLDVSPSIKMKGTRTAVSDDAVEILTEKGFTISITEALS